MSEEPETLKISPLADEWWSSKGGISTLNRELCKGLAQQPNVSVTLIVPEHDQKEKQAALEHNVHLAAADEMPGIDPIMSLSFPPGDLDINVVIGHGQKLGPPANMIAKKRGCKRVHIVHTASEHLAMFKKSEEAIPKGERKHQLEVDLCQNADVVVGIGPKLSDDIKVALRPYSKDQAVFNLTPGIFSEFSELPQASEERDTFHTLVFGRGDYEDFELKGYDIAARAVATLNDKSFKLLFVGAPKGKEEEVKDSLLKCGIDRAQLLVRGFKESRETLARLFCEADLAIMPSRTEGFGLSALEALSAGLPILVSDNSGFGKALGEIPFGSCYVVESDDPEEWGKAIKRVRKKPRPVRLEEARELRSYYHRKFKWQEQCAALVEKIRHLT
ncbi:hypothetical protein ACROYT_G043144 [Oculina patagonica]